MATKTDIELKIVDSVDTSHTDAEVLADSASNPDAFYVGRGYLAKGGEKVIENIDENGTYPNVTVGNATKATTADTATRANTAATAATAVNISDAPVLTATEDEQITVKVGNKTSNALTVPYAQRADFATDLSGRVEATPEVFTYRPSAGDKSIKDDNAFIRRVKGNSVVWNQLVKDSYYSNTQILFGLTCSQELNSRELKISGTYITGSASADYNWYGTAALTNGTIGIVGHKYLCQISGNKECSLTLYGWCSSSTDIFDSIIKECTSAQQLTMAIKLPRHLSAGTTVDETIIIDIHDLTAMFGTGNEPTTVEEFRALYPNSYYPYNAGELRNLVCSGIKTVGFNLVDKNNFLTGVIGGSDTPSQNSNYRYIKVPVFPNTEYYLKDVSNLYYYNSYILYDSNMNRIKVGGLVVKDNYPYNASFVTTTPSNAAYMIVNVYKDFVDTCCVNLHHTGYRDGEYEPYKEVTHALPLSKITNGEPLRKAGEVYDEINETEYIRRVGVVDLGSLAWESVNDSETGLTTFAANRPTDCVSTYTSSDKANIFCTKYATDTWGNIWSGRVDKAIGISYSYIRLRDTSFTTSAALKASLSGVLLQYELAEPIVTPIETPIDFNYYVEDFGTEEAILAENSAPFSADIIYQFNATDQVRNNTRNIQRLQKSVFTPSGTTAQYIRGDGSYADVSELSRVIPIYDGEGEGIDNEDGGQNLGFRLFPHYYAKSKHTANADSYKEVIIRVEAPDNEDFVAEYWFELEIGESIPPIRFENPDSVGTSFRFNGDIQTDAVNIWHIITTDGGMRYFGEIKSYLIE